MSVALLGVMAMQLYFLKQSYNLKSQLFDQSVNQALSKVANKIEKYEAYDYLKKKVEREHQRIREQERPVFVAESPRPKKKEFSRKEKYAYYLKKEQQKADSIFAVRDSILRSKYPYVVAVNEEAGQEQLQYDVNIDVAEFQDIYGGVHQRTITRLVPRPAAPSTDRSDTIKRYLVIDPVKGPQILTSYKPKIRTLSESALKEIEKEKRQAKQI